MPSQQAELADTVATIRKSREREKSAPSRQPIYSTTNRGHKLLRSANHVHIGVLASTYGPERYREKIQHAGFTRYILERNPRRYDEHGNELEDSDIDEDADADAADENAYSGVLIEELLCPLKHPSELATHPSLSLPYLDSALPDMVKSTEQKLQQERASLWRAKNLFREFLGDKSWIPCGAVETNEDWDLFEPKPKRPHRQESRKRKRENEIKSGQAINGGESLQNGTNPQVSQADDEGAPVWENGKLQPSNGDRDTGLATVETDGSASEKAPADVEMKDDNAPPKVNGEIHDVEKDGPTNMKSNDGDLQPIENGQSEQTSNEREEIDGASEEASPQPPPRRITRALAATNNSNAPTPPQSPTPTLTDSSTSSLFEIAPIYMLPPEFTSSHVKTASNALQVTSLPPEEAADVQKLLGIYIQKQEESVRGYEAVLAKLIKAKRMRNEVLEMCKAEGHIGEMSDGEDWIDYQRWNLKPGELKKGKDEDDDAGDEREVAGIGGRKGKRRRN